MAKIRKASLKDLEILHNFNVDLAKYEFQFDPIKKEPQRKKHYPYVYRVLRKKLKKKNYQFFIAEDEKGPIGFIEGFIEKVPAFYKYSKRGNIGPIFVKEEYRNKKTGSKLVKEILKWFKSQGVKWIKLQAYQEDVNALNFWKKMGFEEYLVEMNFFINKK